MTSPMPPLACTVREATPADADAMARVEAGARLLLEGQGAAVDGLALPDGFGEETAWDLAMVALVGPAVVGMARCTALSTELLCLDQVSVLPAWSRRGIGSRLLLATCEAARRRGFLAVTGTTFADVVFNGPLYRRLGAVEDPEPHPVMLRRRAVERELGLDDVGRRIIMRLTL